MKGYFNVSEIKTCDHLDASYSQTTVYEGVNKGYLWC